MFPTEFPETPEETSPSHGSDPATPQTAHRRRNIVAVIAAIVALALAAALAAPALGSKDGSDEEGREKDVTDRPEGCALLPDPTWCDRPVEDWPLSDDFTEQDRAEIGCLVDESFCADDVVRRDRPGRDSDTGDACKDTDTCHDEPGRPPLGNGQCDSATGRPTIPQFDTELSDTTVTARFDVIEGAAPIDHVELDWGIGDEPQRFDPQFPERVVHAAHHTYPRDAVDTYVLTLRAYDTDGRCTSATTERTITPLYRGILQIDYVHSAECGAVDATELAIGWVVSDRGNSRSSYRRVKWNAANPGARVGERIVIDQVTPDRFDEIGVVLEAEDDTNANGAESDLAFAPFDPRGWDPGTLESSGLEGRFGWAGPSQGGRTLTTLQVDGGCTIQLFVDQSTEYLGTAG